MRMRGNSFRNRQQRGRVLASASGLESHDDGFQLPTLTHLRACTVVDRGREYYLLWGQSKSAPSAIGNLLTKLLAGCESEYRRAPGGLPHSLHAGLTKERDQLRDRGMCITAVLHQGEGFACFAIEFVKRRAEGRQILFGQRGQHFQQGDTAKRVRL